MTTTTCRPERRKPMNLTLSESARQAGEALMLSKHARSFSDLVERLIFAAKQAANGETPIPVQANSKQG